MAGDCLHFIGRATGFEQLDRGIFTQTVKAVSREGCILRARFSSTAS